MTHLRRKQIPVRSFFVLLNVCPETLSADIIKIMRSMHNIPLDTLTSALPYAFDAALFVAFVIWNGGIVLGEPLVRCVLHLIFTLSFPVGDKSNHVPAMHVPQLYYFIAFASAFGWPVLLTGPGGPLALLKEVKYRMFGTRTSVRFTLHSTHCLPEAYIAGS